MFKFLFTLLWKLAIAAGVLFAALVVLRLVEDRRGDYIEIYNDEDETLDEELFG